MNSDTSIPKEKKEEAISVDKDLDLIRECKRELPYKTKAFERLLQKYEPLVFKTCLNFFGSTHDAEEVTQDVFLKVFHHIKKFEERSSFKTWLYKIVNNLCFTRIKKVIRHREKKEAFAQNLADREKQRLRVEETKSSKDLKIQTALGKLGEEERQIIILKYLNGFSLNEIAESMDIGLSAAKMRLYRAVDKFKVFFEK